MFDGDTWMGTMGIIFIIALLTLGVWFVRSVVLKGMDVGQASEDGKRRDDYRELAERATKAQEEAGAQLARLDDIERRLGEIERMLREVDEPRPVR
jgi:hypothetical protein